MIMNQASPNTTAEGTDPRLWTLHKRKSGMKPMRSSERRSKRGPDQMIKDGNDNSKRPPKSPMLKSRKCIEVKTKGCVAGFVGCTATVIGGNTACSVGVRSGQDFRSVY
jgi:hypothetical protein